MFMAGVAVAAMTAGVAWAADERPRATQPTANQPADGAKVVAETRFRVNTLTDLNVRNRAGEKLGSVEDFVIDVRTGKIEYLALSLGGWLGIGDKLHAVPFNQLQFAHSEDEQYFVLDLPKEKLEAAPGFDKNAWPNVADANWAAQIDRHYQRQARDTGATEGTLTPRR
jgi:sporulation protein YlmC with PRC-barrel domain